MSIKKTLVPVRDIFPVKGLSAGVKDMQLYVYEHSSDDPGAVFVPRKDENYIFQPKALEAMILAENLNRNLSLFGHTGTGKTSHIMQFCAWRGREVVRQNFDLGVTRQDLVGVTVVIPSEAGDKTITKFRYGSLPISMTRPATFIADEWDIGDPGVTALLNPVLEGENSPVFVAETETYIRPHREWRVVSTGNTDGVNPDPRGIYAGTQTQNAATVNRWAFRVQIDYNAPEVEGEILNRKYPGIPEPIVTKLVAFTKEYRKAFVQTAELTLPLSTRAIHGMAEAALFTGSLKRALEMVLLSATPAHEKHAVEGLAVRVGIDN